MILDIQLLAGGTPKIWALGERAAKCQLFAVPIVRQQQEAGFKKANPVGNPFFGKVVGASDQSGSLVWVNRAWESHSIVTLGERSCLGLGQIKSRDWKIETGRAASKAMLESRSPVRPGFSPGQQ